MRGGKVRPMMTCQQMTALVTDYVEKRMPLLRRLGFRLHLLMCTNCRTYVKQMSSVAKELGRLPPQTVPDEVMVALLAQFGKWKVVDTEKDPP